MRVGARAAPFVLCLLTAGAQSSTTVADILNFSTNTTAVAAVSTTTAGTSATVPWPTSHVELTASTVGGTLSTVSTTTALASGVATTEELPASALLSNNFGRADNSSGRFGYFTEVLAAVGGVLACCFLGGSAWYVKTHVSVPLDEDPVDVEGQDLLAERDRGHAVDARPRPHDESPSLGAYSDYGHSVDSDLPLSPSTLTGCSVDSDLPLSPSTLRSHRDGGSPLGESADCEEPPSVPEDRSQGTPKALWEPKSVTPLSPLSPVPAPREDNVEEVGSESGSPSQSPPVLQMPSPQQEPSPFASVSPLSIKDMMFIERNLDDESDAPLELREPSPPLSSTDDGARAWGEHDTSTDPDTPPDQSLAAEEEMESETMQNVEGTPLLPPGGQAFEDDIEDLIESVQPSSEEVVDSISQSVSEGDLMMTQVRQSDDIDQDVEELDADDVLVQVLPVVTVDQDVEELDADEPE
uniref:Uncharacterized protein n=1 Tax=Noctiluca scintillans TaxID=2966 RepID=A0A7S1B1S3_NOCSC|mmetsp:Transcript_921/g.2617  ORF Transcript_921/g.2617 Transcript_921/m.2617 type:complete len:468 (+) Transcript_921:54-1457(+)|eukprot:CAMPEP_0194518584 /NCGR_PEP_ID=MMETSP0253-20130528/52038_1 /TAXON_ID=2966 /ORGANISM="Noctiluca scintillans" /LENGTH=467 /DNA_ID=CAMNT_0039362641 /DNA_START=13 /DNA_END=1416 /DNA_ORIENTATION=-